MINCNCGGTPRLEANAKSNLIGLWSTSEYQAIAPWEWRKNKRRKKKIEDRRK